MRGQSSLSSYPPDTPSVDMSSLLVGFDSAWTPGNRGAITAALRHDDGTFVEVGDPEPVDFREATGVIRRWQEDHVPASTLILLDQPTVVANASGQRPVENLACGCVSVRRGGMQPAFTGRAAMFGAHAPVWAFLSEFGGAADPLVPLDGCAVLETYPVLAMIALGWLRDDSRPCGRLPKYNPGRRKTFSIEDWQFVCDKAAASLRARGLHGLGEWIEGKRELERPRKVDQDQLDACLCLLVAVQLAAGEDGLMVGNQTTGYIVVPHSTSLAEELATRCEATSRIVCDWVKPFRLC